MQPHEDSLLALVRQSRIGLADLDRSFPGLVQTVAEQYLLLLLVECWIENQEFSVKALFSYYNGSAATFTRFLKRLQAADVVTVREDPKDARARLIAINDTRAAELICLLFDGETAPARPAPDRILRRTRKLDAMPRRFTNALELWTERRTNGLSTLELRDILQLTTGAGEEHIHLADVSADDPENYRYTVFGAVARRALSLFPGNRHVVGRISSRVYREGVIEDYLEAQRSVAPLCQDVVARAGETELSYSRLLLPFSTDGRQVDTMLVCIEPCRFDDLTLG